MDAYVKQVNAVAAGLQAQLGQVAAVNRRFSSRASFSLLRPQLAQSRRTMRTLATRLAALQPPPKARTLAATLARLVATETELTDEMYRFTVFLPAYQKVLVPVDKATNAFRAAAKAAKTATADVKALETFAAAVAHPIVALTKLHPPAIVEPTYATELSTVRGSRRTALDLAAALRAKQVERAHTLAVRLEQISVSSGSVAAQRAEIAAVRAYDAKVTRVSQLAAAAARELSRLQR